MFRPLHYVFRLSNRGNIKDFFVNLLSMKVLRHEEFHEGCEASCNGPYNGKWSKTMMGYGDEDTHFVIELTYNYGIGSYKHSNDLKWILLHSKEVVENVKKMNYPCEVVCNNPYTLSLVSPDGYIFRVVDDNVGTLDPVSEVCLAVANLKDTADYYCHTLPGKQMSSCDNSTTIQFSDNSFNLRLEIISEEIVKTAASGRIAFSYTNKLSEIEEKVKENNMKIKTPLIKLETPGKMSVEVVILLDTNDHEICVVSDDVFRELSKYDPQANNILDKAISKDRSQQWFEKKGEQKKCL